MSPARNEPSASVGGVVAEDQPRDDPRVSGTPNAGGEDEPIGPVAPLGQEDATEPPIPGQHRRQRRDHGELGEKREQELLRREDRGSRRGIGLRKVKPRSRCKHKSPGVRSRRTDSHDQSVPHWVRHHVQGTCSRSR